MAIKNKDGTIFKLRGPNKLMKDQVEWDKAKLRFFNLGYKSEVIIDDKNPVREMANSVIDIGKELNLQKNEAKVIPAKEFIEEICEVPEPIVEEKPVILNVDDRMSRLLRERSVEYYCAPCIGHNEHIDPLYQTKYKTTQFGDKFIFDAIIIDQSDLQLQFWCVRAITIDSVVYRKNVDGGERWWRVTNIEPKTGGYLVLSSVSDLNPDFS